MVAVLSLIGCQKEQVKTAAAGPPVVPVSVGSVTEEAAPVELRVVGTVDASSVVQVKSQVAGQLEQVSFTEGQNVAKGDLLFVIDKRPFQEALRQAEAAVGRDRAMISQAEAVLARDSAQAKFAETDAARYAELSKAGVVSKSQYDQSRTSADVSREAARATQASIESAKAALEADQAAVANAKAEPELLRDPCADLRAHRKPAGARREPREGQRRADGGDQPGGAGVRQFRRAGEAPGVRPAVQRGPEARGDRARQRQSEQAKRGASSR